MATKPFMNMKFNTEYFPFSAKTEKTRPGDSNEEKDNPRIYKDKNPFEHNVLIPNADQ